MKQKLIGGLALIAFVLLALSPQTNAATVTKAVSSNYGTVTYKFTVDTDSVEAIGHYHKSGEAVKTAWVYVPVMTDFLVYTEERDADSAAYTWAGDTLHIALETAPAGGLAIDSVTSEYKRQKASIIWNLANGLSFTALTSQHYFPQGAYAYGADTAYQTVAAAVAAIDTLGFSATSLKDWGVTDMQGGPVPNMNLGALRFSVCNDAADSVLDGLVRLNLYIIFKDPAYPFSQTQWSNVGMNQSYGRVIPGEPTYAYEVLQPAEMPWNMKSRDEVR